MTPQIDCLVAVYNGENCIAGCVRALLDADYPNKKVIVVNDASTDNTRQVLKIFSDAITVLDVPHSGVAASRNAGILRAQAEFIAITDADCQVHADWLKCAMPHMQDPRVGAVTGWLHYRVTNALSAIREAEYAVRFDRRGQQAKSVSCPVALFRKEALLEAGIFDSAFIVGGEDTEIGYRIIESGYQVVYERKMISFHDPEEKLGLYLKRNYRNGVNHIRVLGARNKRVFFNDDFFPLILRFQSVFTGLSLFFLAAWLFTGHYIGKAFFLASLLPILANFFPVAIYAGRQKGMLAFVYAFWVLPLRNLIWLAALVRGSITLVKKRFFAPKA